MKKPLIGIIMGSKSDLPIMAEAAEMLENFGIPFEITIASAHRTPERAAQYATTAQKRGIKAIIAGAGGAAHLPGVIASMTTLPIIGVPIKSTNSIDGWDSILSILQMPSGIPVATVALNGAQNAAILAAQIIAHCDSKVAVKLKEFKKSLKKKVEQNIHELEKVDYKEFLKKPGK
ncbi:MAG: 5-(carboxyamino)imidazole ribonucleotide mutase [Ignavibacteriales bacterium]|nr:5-(carboxyamino)imidazole ribonucleotide mutase [Ignavibacteriales bacterium]